MGMVGKRVGSGVRGVEIGVKEGVGQGVRTRLVGKRILLQRRCVVEVPLREFLDRIPQHRLLLLEVEGCARQHPTPRKACDDNNNNNNNDDNSEMIITK